MPDPIEVVAHRSAFSPAHSPSPTCFSGALTTFLDPIKEGDFDPTSDTGNLGAKASSPQAELACTKPGHPSTANKLRITCNAEDTVIARAAPNEELERDGGSESASHAFVKTTTSITAQRPLEEQPNLATRSPRTKRAKRVSLLNSIDPSNIIDITDNEDEQYAVDTPPTSSVPLSSYSFRNRRATQGKLIYDVKYHPMDDSVRPAQAAKRRLAHGEMDSFLDDICVSYSVHTDSDGEGDRKESESEGEKPTELTRKGKKRAKNLSQSAQPTRRSSRKIAKPRMSYNTSIHPQDRFLEVSSADESDCSTPFNASERLTISRSVEVRARSVDYTITDGREPKGHDMNICEPATAIKTSSPLSCIATLPPYGILRKEGLDVWMLNPGDRYFRHDRDSWPLVQGLPFEIYTERLEDQLAAEANAASPFNYEQDDKENDVVNTRLEQTPNPTEGISVVPLSQYERSRDSSVALQHHMSVNGAFYNLNVGPSSPYGLGGHDGVHEQDDPSTRAVSTTEAMRILASSDKLPRTPGT